MKIRIRESDIFNMQAHHYDPRALTSKIERLLHRTRITRRVEHDRSHFTFGHVGKRCDRFSRRHIHYLCDPEAGLAKIEAFGIHIQDDRVGSAKLHMLENGQADRADSNHDADVPFLNPGPIYRVATYTKRFDQSELFGRELLRTVQLLNRHMDPFAHTAVAVNTHALQ